MTEASPAEGQPPAKSCKPGELTAGRSLNSAAGRLGKAEHLKNDARRIEKRMVAGTVHVQNRPDDGYRMAAIPADHGLIFILLRNIDAFGMRPALLLSVAQPQETGKKAGDPFSPATRSGLS